MKTAAYFFGSGISKPSGKPCVQQITKSAMYGQWHQGSCGRFFPGPHDNRHGIRRNEDLVTPVVQQFLATLERLAREYVTLLSRTSTVRRIHYEDLFSLAEQAWRSDVDHVPNLAVVEFIRRLRDETLLQHSTFEDGTSGCVGFTGLAETASNFLHWVVHHQLCANDTRPAGLGAISETAQHVAELDIFTLNHDLLVEQQLQETKVDCEDGFADHSHGGFRVFNGWPKNGRKAVRLFKLHGSINWYLYQFPGWVRQYAIPCNGPVHSRDQNGTLVRPTDWKAALLSGTVVKEQRYGTGLFGDLFTQFRNRLARHRQLICCGYGFGDTGINNRILQWLCDSLDGSNKLIVLHESSEQDFFEDKPLWMQEMKSKQRLVLIEKWLENCELADIEPYFDDVD